jgi:multiple sugar transport system permease protein
MVFSLFLTALMVPGIMTLLPNFVLIHDLGLTNTFAGLILPGALFSAFGIFFLRQFMLGLSNEIEQAARIDGLGPIGLLFRITIPTVALGVFEQASPESQQDFAGLMAAALVAALPMLLIFVIFGKRIVNSIGFTGIK